MSVPGAPTQTVRVADLVAGDSVIIPMVGSIETVISNADGLVVTDGTGLDSAYLWCPDDSIDIVSRVMPS